eukprot:90018_1
MQDLQLMMRNINNWILIMMKSLEKEFDEIDVQFIHNQYSKSKHCGKSVNIFPSCHQHCNIALYTYIYGNFHIFIPRAMCNFTSCVSKMVKCKKIIFNGLNFMFNKNYTITKTITYIQKLINLFYNLHR